MVKRVLVAQGVSRGPGVRPTLNVLEVGVFEERWVLQAEPEHPVDSDMRQPDYREEQGVVPMLEHGRRA
jgi:hypothetical protein